jgi:benzoyl-CoA reductase subunit D
MTITAGIDIGTGAVKTVLFEIDGDRTDWLGRRTERIWRRDPMTLARAGYDALLDDLGLAPEHVAYVATTGEGENVPFRTGHFYSMTTHARGGIYLDPEARAVLDVGALHGRAIRIDGRGKVLSYKMTSQCASGSGQFLENIARYLGVALDEIGPLSAQADDPEKVSGICAVLAETDVINMVSRGISKPNILKGIHLSMAGRLVKLLKAIKVVDGAVLMSGGLALDHGLVATMREQMVEHKVDVGLVSHPDSIYAGAIGAALWGAFRHQKLAQLDQHAFSRDAGIVPGVFTS